MFPEVLLCRYWGVEFVLNVLHYHSAHFYHPNYVGSPSDIAVVSLLNDSLSSCCTATVDLMGKESESLQVSFSFTLLS